MDDVAALAVATLASWPTRALTALLPPAPPPLAAFVAAMLAYRPLPLALLVTLVTAFATRERAPFTAVATVLDGYKYKKMPAAAISPVGTRMPAAMAPPLPLVAPGAGVGGAALLLRGVCVGVLDAELAEPLQSGPVQPELQLQVPAAHVPCPLHVFRTLQRPSMPTL